MRIFNFLKKNEKKGITFRSGSYFDTDISDPDLRVLINHAITVFLNNPSFDCNELIDAIRKHGCDESLAMALFRFIPIAYCRIFLPEPEYSDIYILYKDNRNRREYSFSEDRIYNIVLEESKARYFREGSEEEILPILNHSADFRTINDALRHSLKLEDQICGPTYFL